MKKIEVLFVVLVLLSLNLVLASFTTGNLSHEIEAYYGANKPVKGWINISLTDEPTNSLLTAFDSKMKIKDFLEENSVYYECFPLDCNPTYSTTSSKSESKTFSLSQDREKLIGINITGLISQINDLVFNVSTDAENSCIYPLQIDVLDDDSVEWKQDEITESDCFISNPSGCFGSSQALINITKTAYCEKITLPPSKAYRIGAKVSGEGRAYFHLFLDELQCPVDANSSGEISCVIEFEEAFESSREAVVCLKERVESANKYQIKYEDNEPVCGFRGTEDEDTFYDFDIFAKPQRYAKIEEPIFFENDLIGEDAKNTLMFEIKDYLSIKYNDDCTEGCIIPIKFLSGVNQEITISDLSLEYEVTTDLNPISISNFYIIEGEPSLITSNLKQLDLGLANLLTLSTIGQTTLSLKLSDTEIFNQDIIIKDIPEIEAVLPSKPSSLVPTNFIVILDEPMNNVTYTWDFGDSSQEMITTNSFAKHTYSTIGVYDLKLTVRGSFGESSKTLKINVVAPAEAINQTIKDYRANLKNLRKQINDLPSNIKLEVERLIDLEDLEKQVNKREEKYKDAFIDEEFVEVMKELLALQIPEELSKEFSIGKTNFFQNVEEISLQDLEELDVGVAEAEVEEYYSAINNWMGENLDISFETDTYSFNYKDSFPDTLFSFVKLTIIPNGEIDELYVLINGNPDKIKVPVDFKEKDIEEGAKAVILTELLAGETTTLEIFHPFKVDLDNFPIYLSPDFSELDLSAAPPVCNSNGVCESGETTKNCRDDCKPWKTAMFLIIVLLIIAFIVYIVLQEWYKRRYESHLFKDKNQLFNLISFMNISIKQGITKENIFNQLQKRGWNKEQTIYAWRKYKGQRTGMWEIPIFGIWERRKLKKELKNRPNVNQPPRPAGQMPTKKTSPDNRKVNKEKLRDNYKRF